MLQDETVTLASRLESSCGDFAVTFPVLTSRDLHRKHWRACSQPSSPSVGLQRPHRQVDMAALWRCWQMPLSLSWRGRSGCVKATHCSCNEKQTKPPEFEKTGKHFSCQLYLRSYHWCQYWVLQGWRQSQLSVGSASTLLAEKEHIFQNIFWCKFTLQNEDLPWRSGELNDAISSWVPVQDLTVLKVRQG